MVFKPKYTPKLIIKANKEAIPIMWRLILKFKKVALNATIDDIIPPEKK